MAGSVCRCKLAHKFATSACASSARENEDLIGPLFGFTRGPDGYDPLYRHTDQHPLWHDDHPWTFWCGDEIATVLGHGAMIVRQQHASFLRCYCQHLSIRNTSQASAASSSSHQLQIDCRFTPQCCSYDASVKIGISLNTHLHGRTVICWRASSSFRYSRGLAARARRHSSSNSASDCLR